MSSCDGGASLTSARVKKIEEKEDEEESDAGGVGFKGRAARWLNAGHWRDGEEERMGEEREEVGDGVNGDGEGRGGEARGAGVIAA